MTKVVEAVELQFIKLRKQIQLEKEICRTLESQLATLKNNIANIEINNELKCSLENSANVGIQCSESSITSLQASLLTTTILINEIKKVVGTQIVEYETKDLARKLEMYECNWKSVQKIYKHLPVANEVNMLETLKKQTYFSKVLKCKEISDLKTTIATYQNIKEKQMKALTVKLALFALKGKVQFIKNLHLKEKTESFASELYKLKHENSSLTTNMHIIIQTHNPLTRLKITDDSLVPSPSLGMLEKKSRMMSIDQRCHISPADVSSYKLPQLMVPAFKSSLQSSTGQNTCVGGYAKQPGSSMKRCTETALDDNENMNNHRKSGSTVSCSNVNDDKTQIPLQSTQEQSAKTLIINENDVSGPRKLQPSFGRTNNEDKTTNFNLNPPRKQKSNVWDIFN